jgi:acyl-CoA thioester hydrolase
MAKPIRFSYSYLVQVAWGDMDAFGHINNVIYARYFETARADFFTKLKIWGSVQKPSSSGPVLTHLEMDYRKQVVFPAILDVTVAITSYSSRGFNIATSMWDQEDNCVLSGIASIVWFDFETGRPASLTEEMKQLFESLIQSENQTNQKNKNP